MQKKVTRKHSRSRIDQMINAIRGEIMTGERGIGTYLPSESELEKRFRLGNDSVRKGLEQLVREQLIRKIPRVGSVVIARPAPEEATIRVGIYSTTDRETDISDMLDRFHEKHPHIRVQTETIPTGEYARYIERHMTEGTLDAAFVNQNTFRQMSAEAKIRLLEPFAPLPDCYPFTTEPFALEGRLLVRPLLFSPLVICYNVDHLKERRLPEPANEWTWSELIELARNAAVENERFGFCFHLLSRNRWPVFLLQSGVNFAPDEHGRYMLPDEALIESLGVCRSLLEQPGVFPAMLSGLDSAAVEWFKDGRVSMIMTTYFSLNQLRQTDIRFDVAPLPYVREKRNLLACIGMVVNRRSAKKEAARRLVDFLASYESQLAIRKRTFSVPALRQAAEWEGETDVRHPPRFGIFQDMIPSFRQLEHLPLNARELAAIQKHFELFLTGLQDGASMCRQMERTLYEMNRTSIL
ncbi:extracellular solute-binding protein [Paenibacillus sp. GYB003]|uniref:extracellular solute-binding protein n=1 Tax=Paenibacillus sp. GYB003 TaxID=2994392 RepID=UPI002F96D22D